LGRYVDFGGLDFDGVADGEADADAEADAAVDAAGPTLADGSPDAATAAGSTSVGPAWSLDEAE
jgi:hypothetical protein